jgi:hypothetical protein
MAPLKLGKPDRDGKGPKAKSTERRSGSDRRSGEERPYGSKRRDGGRRQHIRDLYQSDLDRHLWSWTSPKRAKKKKRASKTQHVRRRRVARLVASAAGALSAAGLSYFLWRRLRKEELPEDPVAAQADLDEADFDEG